MCVIVRTPVGAQLTRNEVEDMFLTNSDGLGVMWADNGHVMVAKSLPSDVNQAWEFYERHCTKVDREYLIHFRLATHGKVTMANCHPVGVTGHIGLMHNGIMRCVEEDRKNDRSDTRVFAEDYLSPILEGHTDLMDEPALVEVLEHFIGLGNIVAMMRNDGTVVILNRESGEYITDERRIWVSNKNWEWGYQSHWSNYGSWKNSSWQINGTHTDITSSSSHIQYDRLGNRVHYDQNTGEIVEDESEDNSAFGHFTVSGFFALLHLSAYHRAHTKLSIMQVQTAMKYANRTEWYLFMKEIEQGQIKERELLGCVRRPKEWFDGCENADGNKVMIGTGDVS